jgi:hypothetical protein
MMLSDLDHANRHQGGIVRRTSPSRSTRHTVPHGDEDDDNEGDEIEVRLGTPGEDDDDDDDGEEYQPNNDPDNGEDIDIESDGDEPTGPRIIVDHDGHDAEGDMPMHDDDDDDDDDDDTNGSGSDEEGDEVMTEQLVSEAVELYMQHRQQPADPNTEASTRGGDEKKTTSALATHDVDVDVGGDDGDGDTVTSGARQEPATNRRRSRATTPAQQSDGKVHQPQIRRRQPAIASVTVTYPVVPSRLEEVAASGTSTTSPSTPSTTTSTKVLRSIPSQHSNQQLPISQSTSSSVPSSRVISNINNNNDVVSGEHVAELPHGLSRRAKASSTVAVDRRTKGSRGDNKQTTSSNSRSSMSDMHSGSNDDDNDNNSDDSKLQALQRRSGPATSITPPRRNSNSGNSTMGMTGSVAPWCAPSTQPTSSVAIAATSVAVSATPAKRTTLPERKHSKPHPNTTHSTSQRRPAVNSSVKDDTSHVANEEASMRHHEASDDISSSAIRATSSISSTRSRGASTRGSSRGNSSRGQSRGTNKRGSGTRGRGSR